MEQTTFELLMVITLVLCIIGIIISICKCKKTIILFVAAFIIVALLLINIYPTADVPIPTNVVHPDIGTSKDLAAIFN